MPNVFVTAKNRYGYSVGATVSVSDSQAVEAQNAPQWGTLADARLPTNQDALDKEYLGANWIPLSGPYTLQSSDDGKSFYCTTPLTITIPVGLLPRPSCLVMPPPSGVVTFTGVAQLNGSPQSLTRARTANPAGVPLNPWPDVDGFGLGGS